MISKRTASTCMLAMAAAIIVTAALIIASYAVPGVCNCFGMPSNPSKADVLTYINRTYSCRECGCSCNLAALYATGGQAMLDRYNISVNLTRLRNSTVLRAFVLDYYPYLILLSAEILAMVLSVIAYIRAAEAPRRRRR